MASEVSTIQSLKAVDAWIDVINANINGGVRTAFKSSRLKFSGSNVDIQRTGNATSLPLQFPEPGLTTANTVIDFTQGAVTASTENAHLAIQGDGFFVVATPDLIDRNPASATFGATLPTLNGKFYLTRDGEFRTDANGLLVNSQGLYLTTIHWDGSTLPNRLLFFYDTATFNGAASNMRAVFNDKDATPGGAGIYIRLSEYMRNTNFSTPPGNLRDNQGTLLSWATSLVTMPQGKQSMRFSQYGSTIFDFGFQAQTVHNGQQYIQEASLGIGYDTNNQILGKSLEASNASMTQSVPELSLAQKLFSALTKVLQTKQTNIDGVLNLVR